MAAEHNLKEKVILLINIKLKWCRTLLVNLKTYLNTTFQN